MFVWGRIGPLGAEIVGGVLCAATFASLSTKVEYSALISVRMFEKPNVCRPLSMLPTYLKQEDCASVGAVLFAISSIGEEVM